MGAPIVDTSRLHELQRLQSEIARMQRRHAEASSLPLDPALADLLPGGGLRTGVPYSMEPSPGLVGALLAPPSQEGMWCAIVGMPTIGLEALAGFGVDLDRLVLVPDPGRRWLAIVSALSEVVPLMALHPRARPGETDAARLNARLRDRGCTLLVTSPWPQSEATLRLEDPQWHGLHRGWGLLEGRAVTVTATGRRQATPQRVRVLLPGPAGCLAPVPQKPALPAPIPLRPRASAPAHRDLRHGDLQHGDLQHAALQHGALQHRALPQREAG